MIAIGNKSRWRFPMGVKKSCRRSKAASLNGFLSSRVKATGPILNHSASEYVNGQHLADLQVTSTLD